MRKILLAAFLAPLLSMTCTKKEGPNCHHNIVYKNNSDFTVLRAELYMDGKGKCRFAYNELKPGEEFTDYSRSCWEDRSSTDFYILSPENVQVMSVENLYSCDSIATKNKILKHYVLTADYLRERNWTVTYPE